jgi:hypothetical protein
MVFCRKKMRANAGADELSFSRSIFNRSTATPPHAILSFPQCEHLPVIGVAFDTVVPAQVVVVTVAVLLRIG